MTNLRRLNVSIVSVFLLTTLLCGAASAQWTSRGGPIGVGIIGAPKCVSQQPNRIDCLARGADDAMHHTRWDGDAWSSWESLGKPATAVGVAGHPMCVSASANRINCFVRGTDNAMYERWWTGTRWRGWESRGKPVAAVGVAAVGVAGDPMCVSASADRINCFVRGTDKAMYEKRWTGTAWGDWQSRGTPTGAVEVASDPMCVSASANRINCFVRGTDNAMHQTWWTGTRWRGWESLGGPIGGAGIAGAPNCVTWDANRVDCLVRATNKAMYHTWWDSGPTWKTWESRGPTITTDPNCVSWGPKRIDCFILGTDGFVYHQWLFDGIWSRWRGLGGPPGDALTNAPRCVSWAENRLDCFGASASAVVQHRWWNGCSWNEPAVPHGLGPVPSTDLVAIRGVPGDRDGDGLPDSWEEERRPWGLDPDRADLILVPVLRPNVARVDVEPNIEMAKEFFRRIPVRSVSGAVGINVVVRWGRPLDQSFREDAKPTVKGYPDARAPGMPPELVGFGHGLLVGTGTRPGCGGGQTSGSDWAGVSNNWPTFVHELGHQLGLAHEPLGSGGVPSPFYTSLMNYDYNYGFDDDLYKIHFSRGEFASLRLDEASISETLPFPSSALSFLTKGPYEFKIRSAKGSPTSTQVDFNRNGEFEESNVSADINDGSALVIKDRDAGPLPKVSGDVALASMGATLIAFAAELPSVDVNTFHGKGATESSKGRLNYYTVSGGRVTKTGRVFDRFTMTGAASALANSTLSKVLVTYPGGTGFTVSVYEVRGDGSLVVNDSAGFRGRREAHLVSTAAPEKFYVLAWDRTTKIIEIFEVTSWTPLRFGPSGRIYKHVVGSAATPILSNTPPAVAYNGKIERLVLLTTEDDHIARNRLKLWILGPYKADLWIGGAEMWVAGSDVRTSDRPAIAFDDRDTSGPHGRYLIYFRRDGDDAAALRQMGFVRLMPPHRTGSGAMDSFVFRHKTIINQWATTRNAPVVIKHQDDYVFGWRRGVEPSDANYNKFSIMGGATGEYSSGMTDFDDVTHIATRGLRESLIGIRR